MSVSSDSARDLLIGMVSTPSPSGEERAAAERLVDFFEAHDREARIDAVGNVRAPADDRVLLTSHIDTVPGDIPVRTEEGVAPEGQRDGSGETAEVLWGRGSVDATGPLCAMAVAAVDSGTSFAGVVGEETDSRGAWYLLQDREPPDALINGEPSGWDGITLGYRGMLAGTYVATSESGHTSRPEPNAIQHAIGWWGRIEERFSPSEDEEWGPVFERVTTKPVSIEGGTDEDGLSVSATLDGQFRVPPSMTTGEVREIAEGELRTDTDAAGTVNWSKPIPPVMESPRTELARAFRVAIRGEDGDPRLLRKTGTSDMNIYASAWDCPMVTYGPGDSDLDHAPDERLDLSEYDRSIAVLTEVADRL
ncbi:[LysW]-lysine hydrolase [Halalkalicoccus jeotgali]|uniref:Putative [LysW]-lysine/[LysW]-ornithine hydrolase n=1 Tax=Halalkalicoccus jeotgali (strain DSM 18796 / CECT 7217 / JCM 14584 / KCTC 4019 / B3) TaxID=795797 RepID=D8J506_HALJB|nr:[LysW]-lysine hydrolase [Halalkalicoccus jeotgali]ADJ13587.1 acetyl-lysine deacetylase [Halalkalicoccus jeotgali B3]ELY33392.1 acetyl-lysine deacetylase [Halalkalicoccus jeotgali B3]